VATFVGAISISEPHNWDRCKAVGLWGVPKYTFRVRSVKAGDRLFIWRTRAGFIAEARVTGPPRVPVSKDEAPWPGGLSRFSAVIPIAVVQETSTPYRLAFVKDRQEVTGLSSNSLRFGLVPIGDEAGDNISAALTASTQ